MEVTQTRLTNVYDSVEAYNAATTGATVPYHVLVLAGFPAGIGDRAAELLGRLARNGPRSGLYIVATIDPGLDLPRGFDLAGLGELGTTLSLDERGDLGWDDPDFAGGVIEPDQMPEAARANPWLDAVGAAAGSAYRDLPFGRIAVPAARRWAGNATDGLDVQIGVDSKGEPQHFTMGVRGVHHGLVGGDVRMGKTNLLHVLISQLALRYPPEELELYLLDFKEVEFDAYLTERLPHARAITSRTDREFGLSMLRRFHEEIERRARLCREARVTDLPDYRRETGQVLPRALVIMDEFQVLFSEEDRLAREAGRLLADIAKRGAAFGLHLLLATQSPGGPLAAYLRPVYEQMALRIALGCTQPSVSQAILGEGNDAATRLVRAGDAIYNDRRGEGANPVMRIAMLPTRERLALIGDIRAFGGGREYPPPASFDPDAPASFAPAEVTPGEAAPGEAAPGEAAGTAGAAGTGVAGRGDRDQARHHRDVRAYPRSNLLIVGGEEHGHGLLLATLLSAAYQRPPAQVRFTIAEFTRPSSPFHGFFDPVRSLPHEVRIADRRTVAEELDDLADDLEARLEGSGRARVRPAGTVLPPRRDAPVARAAGRGRLRPAERDLGPPGPAGRQGAGRGHPRGGLDRRLRHRRTRPAPGGPGLLRPARGAPRALPRGERRAARGVGRRQPGRRPRPVPGHRMAGRAGREVQAVLDRLPVRLRPGRIPDHEREMEPSMTTESATATSPYLSLRQAVRPAILAHRLLAGDQERAGKLATECEDLLYLTGELLKAAGRARILATAPPPRMPDEGGGDRRAQLLEAYADAGLLWAKVVGSSLALAGVLIERGEWEDVRALASFLAGAGEESAAAELRIQLGRAAWETHREQLRAVSNDMPPAAIEPAINALRAVLREVPEEYPDRNREVNRFLPAAGLGHTRDHERTGGRHSVPQPSGAHRDGRGREVPGHRQDEPRRAGRRIRRHLPAPRREDYIGEPHGWGSQRYRGTGRIQGAPDAVQSRPGREFLDHAGPLA